MRPTSRYNDHIRSDDRHTYRQTDPNSIYSENLAKCSSDAFVLGQKDPPSRVTTNPHFCPISQL